jgi:hypothetical protein
LHKTEVELLTNVTSVLCSGNISVYSEPPVDAANLFTCNILWDKRLDPVPQLVMKSLIDNPVEVVSKHAGVLSLRPHGRIRNELHRLAGGDN